MYIVRSDGSTPSDKLYVTEIKNIFNSAGMPTSSLVNDGYFLIYPSMVPGDISPTDLARAQKMFVMIKNLTRIFSLMFYPPV